MADNERKEKVGLKNSLVRLSGKKHQKDSDGSNSASKISGSIVTVCGLIVAVICVIGCAYYWGDAIMAGVAEAKEAYDSAKSAKVDQMRQFYKDEGYRAGEKEYHTSNRVVISIDDVREITRLQVMEVSDVVYVVNQEKTQEWLKAIGIGTYTVNMAAGEYLIDNERQYVCIRIPKPTLDVRLDKAERVFFKNESLLNGSIRKGVEDAQNQRAEAQIELQNDIESDQKFYQKAEESAKEMIKNLVIKFNPYIPDITVDVEFFD